MDEYPIAKKIARGSFADVFLSAKCDKLYAIKRVSFQNISVRIKERLMTEASIMRDLNHPNIVKLYDVIWKDDEMNLVMEYCNNGTLAIEMRKLAFVKPNIKETQIKKLMREVKNGLMYLHQRGYIHRDLKPDNILLHRDDDVVQVKIADFGFARQIDTDMMATCCGSPVYMAPEVIRGECYDSSIDLWSYGTILYELLYGYHPIKAKNVKDLQFKLTNEVIKYPSNKYSENVIDLLKRLLVKESDKRISWDEFDEHEWFEEIMPSIELTNSITNMFMFEHQLPQPEQQSFQRNTVPTIPPHPELQSDQQSPQQNTILATSLQTKQQPLSVPIPIPGAPLNYSKINDAVDDYVVVDGTQYQYLNQRPLTVFDSFMYWCGYERIKR
jgi:serine/threonine-protein kinase ULK/ATG1